jgi:NADH-quinone oxidoreductase subunit J
MNSFPGTEYILLGIFVLCLLTLAIGALIAVLSTRLIRSVVGLAICCFGLAGLYYFLHSPFLALMEILIYVGAVCVTLVFAIMLAEPHEPKAADRATGWLWGGGAIALAIALFVALWQLGAGAKWAVPVRLNDGSMQAIGVSLMTTYSMAFEMISLALLVAILGALAIARPGRTKETQ